MNRCLCSFNTVCCAGPSKFYNLHSWFYTMNRNWTLVFLQCFCVSQPQISDFKTYQDLSVIVTHLHSLIYAKQAINLHIHSPMSSYTVAHPLSFASYSVFTPLHPYHSLHWIQLLLSISTSTLVNLQVKQWCMWRQTDTIQEYVCCFTPCKV